MLERSWRGPELIAAMNSSHLLWVAAGVVIVFKAWQGWRLGLVRQVISLGALAVGIGCGVLGGRAVGAMLSSVLTFPEQVLSAVGGLLLGFGVFAAISILSAILFKKTSDQGIALVRVGYGLSGAALGAFYGLLLVGAFALGLRLLGVVAETKLAIEKNAYLAGGKVRAPDPFAKRLATVKASIEAGMVGAVLRKVDPLPETTYSTLTKLAALVSDSRSIGRFLGTEGVRPVMDHPKVVALLSDPEVSKAIAQRRYLALLSNPRVVAAADDPDISKRLRSIDYEKALDAALRKPPGER